MDRVNELGKFEARRVQCLTGGDELERIDQSGRCLIFIDFQRILFFHIRVLLIGTFVSGTFRGHDRVVLVHPSDLQVDKK